MTKKDYMTTQSRLDGRAILPILCPKCLGEVEYMNMTGLPPTARCINEKCNWAELFDSSKHALKWVQRLKPSISLFGGTDE